MTNIIQKHIKSLAVAYHAYCAAVQAEDDNGTALWGQMLIEAQDATGVELHPRQHIESNIASARRELARQRAAAHADVAAANS